VRTKLIFEQKYMKQKQWNLH